MQVSARVNSEQVGLESLAEYMIHKKTLRIYLRQNQISYMYVYIYWI